MSLVLLFIFRWLKDASKSINDYNCITQKGTQPSQACSDGQISLLPYATVVFLCIRVEL